MIERAMSVAVYTVVTVNLGRFAYVAYRVVRIRRIQGMSSSVATTLHSSRSYSKVHSTLQLLRERKLPRELVRLKVKVK